MDHRLVSVLIISRLKSIGMRRRCGTRLLVVLTVALLVLSACNRNRGDDTADVEPVEATVALLQQYKQTSTPDSSTTDGSKAEEVRQATPTVDQPDVTEAPSMAAHTVALPSPTPSETSAPAPVLILPAPTATLAEVDPALALEAVLPTATATLVELLPTDTPTDTPTDSAPTATETPVPLPSLSPTETPTETAIPADTPTPVSLAERDVVADGYTLMRLALSGEGFDSTGRPINTEFEARTTRIGGDTLASGDRWCIQLGLVHIWIDLTYELDANTGELLVRGTVSLHSGLCEDQDTEPKAILSSDNLMDVVDVDLRVPTGTTAQITYNLQALSSLFGISGLLDSDTGVIVELHVTHKQPSNR